ncbi:hypothetical protein GCM10023238_35460 [Streptomyces heliomycini]
MAGLGAGLAVLAASVAGPSPSARRTSGWATAGPWSPPAWAGGTTELTPIREGIVWELRLPRTLLAAVCGAGLAVCGAVMQSLLRNPLADPFVLASPPGVDRRRLAVVVLGAAAVSCPSPEARSWARSARSRWCCCSVTRSAGRRTAWCCPGWPRCSCSPP